VIGICFVGRKGLRGLVSIGEEIEGITGIIRLSV